MIHIALLLLLSAFANTPIQASDIEDNASFYAEQSLADSYSDAKKDRARQYKQNHLYKKNEQSNGRRQKGITTTRNTMNDDALEAEKLKMLRYYSQISEYESDSTSLNDDTTAKTDSQISEYESDSASLNDDTSAKTYSQNFKHKSDSASLNSESLSEQYAPEGSEFMKSIDPKFISKQRAIIRKKAFTIAPKSINNPSLADCYSPAKNNRAQQYELQKYYHARDRQRALVKKHLNNAEYGQSHIKKSNESESNHPQAIQASNDTRFQKNTPQTNLIGRPTYKQNDARKPQEATVDTLCKILVVSGLYKTVDTCCEPREVQTKYRRMEFLIPHNGNSAIAVKTVKEHPYFHSHYPCSALCHVARSKLSPMRRLLPSNQIKSFMSQLCSLNRPMYLSNQSMSS